MARLSPQPHDALLRRLYDVERRLQQLERGSPYAHQYDKDTTEKIVIGNAAGGGHNFQFYDSNATPRIRVGMDGSGTTGLWLWNSGGGLVWSQTS